MKRIILFAFLVFASFTVTLAADSLSVYEAERGITDNKSLNSDRNTDNANKGNNTKEWITLGFAVVIALGQVISTCIANRSTIDTNKSTVLRQEKEKLENRCSELAKQLCFMYKVEDILQLQLLGEQVVIKTDGLSDKEIKKIESQRDKKAKESRDEIRRLAGVIVGYSFNSNYTRRMIKYQAKKNGSILCENYDEKKEYMLFEQIEGK